ncbi:hypothetical protein [Natronobeatus ordinarius]|uniref:hypothetical protein n=1 Tax=Natronobeatus ordinarius TaxID=2963433 RepID=UPI0020CBF2BF|nr:hypothetical protein [Natronobeatus ordinarius]
MSLLLTALWVVVCLGMVGLVAASIRGGKPIPTLAVHALLVVLWLLVGSIRIFGIVPENETTMGAIWTLAILVVLVKVAEEVL